MTQPVAPKNGLNALLTPGESVLVLIDHQPFQFANLHSHEPTMVVNNVVALAKTAKIFNVPTILTTVLEDRGGKLIKGCKTYSPIKSRSIVPGSTPGKTPASSMQSKRPVARR
jgi:nicotinamidase-related amidase